MIEHPLVKELLSKIVEKDHEEILKKNFRERYPDEEIPEGIDNLIRALELPPEEIQYIANDIKDTVEKTIIPIIQSLIDGVETDEEIAEKTGIKLNIVRKILYKLYDLKIANYKRSKNPETQWFTYSWKFDEDELINRIQKDCEEKKLKLSAELDEERNNIFFVCPLGHVRYNFDEASDEDFFCPCGEELIFQDNAPIIENIESQIKQIDKDLKSFTKKVNKKR
jgi:transcription initiation factor TFIIE subunit alpha